MKNYNPIPSPELIRFLDLDQIFVFGSNEAGIHGAGAAKQARKFGAIIGKGIGFVGNTYAIPTKDKNLQTLSLDKIKGYIDDFLIFAKDNPQYDFLVTKVGCGLAGLEEYQIWPFFQDCSYNVHLPANWITELQKENQNGN